MAGADPALLPALAPPRGSSETPPRTGHARKDQSTRIRACEFSQDKDVLVPHCWWGVFRELKGGEKCPVEELS